LQFILSAVKIIDLEGSRQEQCRLKMSYVQKKRMPRIRSEKNRGRVETQPRFKIQYPMKNRDKDAV